MSRRPRAEDIKKKQQSLPVYQYKQRIKSTVIQRKITLIVGETGSGKTTQIPQYLLEWNQVSPQQRVVCTQPRTVAAINVAQRVAFEQGQSIGRKVGYHIRLDRKFSEEETVLEYMTEGVLLRKAMSCDNLGDYKVVIVDEAHERTVNADLLMGFLKQMVKERADLRVIIMSATLDTKRFAAYFKDPELDSTNSDNPPILAIPGKMNPIQHHWLREPTPDYKQDVIDLIVQIHKEGVEQGAKGHCIPNGHILVFLTGQQEIDLVVQEFQNDKHTNRYGHGLEVYPLYSALSDTDRQNAFNKPDYPRTTRKCVVATNIAETSLTIEDVVYVIDCGLSRQKVYSPSKGVEILEIRGISKASVKQRVGRAGRTKPGIAYHLYTKEGFINLSNETAPEIIRSGLANEILSMLALGIKNPMEFDYIDPPDELTLARALTKLQYLNAIDTECRITDIGHKMARFPVNPHMAKSLVMSAKQQYRCVYEMIVIAAMLEVEDGLWMKPRSTERHRLEEYKQSRKLFNHVSGDHLTLLNIFNAFQLVRNDRYQKKRFCDTNYLSLRKLERAHSIKQQIERVMANILREESKSDNHNNNDEITSFAMTRYLETDYYERIIKALLCGHFMNIAVKGFKKSFWRFRIVDVNDSGREKFVDVIGKAKCRQNSMFDKQTQSALFDSNWVIYHEVTIQQTTQLKIITAFPPQWLLDIDSNGYFNVDSLAKDATPIANVLKQIKQRIGSSSMQYMQQHPRQFGLGYVGGNGNNNNNYSDPYHHGINYKQQPPPLAHYNHNNYNQSTNDFQDKR